MNRSLKQRMREERRRERLVQIAFDSYLDHTVDRLVTLGLDDTVALEAVFHAVDHLGNEGILPLFPEGNVDYRGLGEWLVAAADFGFVDFMMEVATE